MEKKTTNQPRQTRQTQCAMNMFTRRIGSTTYRVSVHFSQTNKETAKDKIARLVRNDTGTVSL